MTVSSARVLSVNVSDNTGERKRGVGSRRAIPGRGLEGDAHAGDWHRQVSLLAVESIERMKGKGIEVGPGDFAENLTTGGIDLLSLPVGSRLLVGGRVLLEISQIGKECEHPCAIYHQVGDCVMPKEGVFATVEEGGEISVGDRIEVVEDAGRSSGA